MLSNGNTKLGSDGVAISKLDGLLLVELSAVLGSETIGTDSDVVISKTRRPCPCRIFPRCSATDTQAADSDDFAA